MLYHNPCRFLRLSLHIPSYAKRPLFPTKSGYGPILNILKIDSNTWNFPIHIPQEVSSDVEFQNARYKTKKKITERSQMLLGCVIFAWHLDYTYCLLSGLRSGGHFVDIQSVEGSSHRQPLWPWAL